jgi:hypothetical protein
VCVGVLSHAARGPVWASCQMRLEGKGGRGRGGGEGREDG